MAERSASILNCQNVQSVIIGRFRAINDGIEECDDEVLGMKTFAEIEVISLRLE